jgi:hypothetical protein
MEEGNEAAAETVKEQKIAEVDDIIIEETVTAEDAVDVEEVIDVVEVEEEEKAEVTA